MHAMLRQNQVRQQDVKPYIRTFTRSNPLDLNEWAKEEGGLFEAGTLIFLLEPAKRPPGMSSFARGQGPLAGAADAAQDGYRVKDMCVVVDKIDGKCWVLAISPSAFELRFIDTLFREKTQKAFLEGLDFQYLACAPRPVLNDSQMKELRQLSTLYSKSGSRRTMAQDGSGPEEPARAMLTFLGADLSAIGKQMIELGLICNLIFSPEGVQENKTQSQVKSCFTPILATDKLSGSAPPAPPTHAAVVENQELLNEEVSLLSQAYLENEAREAADYLAFNQTESTASPPAEIWTSTPAAPTGGAGGDEFKPLTPPPSFDLGGTPSFTPPGAAGVQPAMGLSPDMPALLTGEHKVISINEKLSPEDTNGQTKVPALPAWYMTTHDIEEMNKVALKRAQEAPAEIPDGLDKLESELSYDALPVVDARFRQGAEPPVAEAFAPDADTLISGAQTQAQQEASGAWASPTMPASAPGRDFVDSIFENSGARGTLETNPDATSAEKERGPAGDWQRIDDTASSANAGFVAPGSTARGEIPDPGNLFDRLGGTQPEVEQPAAPTWADGERGRPTNLKDMLTADSAVFSTDSRKLQDIGPSPTAEFASPIPVPDATMPGASSAELAAANAGTEPVGTPDVSAKAGTTDDAGESPAPWMNLPPKDAAPTETSSSTNIPAVPEPATQSSSSWDQFSRPEASEGPAETPSEELALAEPAAAETASEAHESGAKPAEQGNIQELATAMRGLMTSPDAIVPGNADRQAETAVSAEPTEDSTAASPSSEAKSEPSGDTAAVAESASSGESDYYSFDDNRDQTMDLDMALLQRLSSGPATLHSTPSQDSEDDVTSGEDAPSTPPQPVSESEPSTGSGLTPSFTSDTSLVSSAMAAHAQSMVEPEASAEPTSAEKPESPQAPAEPTSATPLRPGRRRTAELRAGITPPPIPQEAFNELPSEKSEVSGPLSEEVAKAETSPEEVEASSAIENVSPTAETATGESSPQATDTSEAPTDLVSEPDHAMPTSPASEHSMTSSQENEALRDLTEGFDDEPSKPVPYGQESKITASSLQRANQPSVEPKLVISESTRFMARLNQRLSEADKKLSSRCDQSRDRLLRELDALVEEAHKVERQNELSTGALTEQLITHLETVSDEVKARIEKTSKESCEELNELIESAEATLAKMHTDLKKELDSTETNFQADSDSLTDGTRTELNQHAQERINDFNHKLDEITNALEAVYNHHIDVLMTRFGKFQARLNEEVDAIISALDRNVGSMTVEIDGSWDRASEKLMASQTEFGNSVNYLVHSCRAELKQLHLESYAKKVLPRLLENKDIFRSMLLDMKRNFEEQSDKIRKQQLASLSGSIATSRTALDNLTKECLSTIESVGKGQQFGLEELHNSTSTRLDEIISTVETKLKSAKQEIIDNDEACMKTSEASRVEDEPAFSKEKQQAIAALNECRTKADNALETHISSSCLNLEHLSEEMQEDLSKQRSDWTAQVRSHADESIDKVKQAIQDAFQAIETAKENHMV